MSAEAVLQATLQGAALAGLSNVMAQAITSYTSNTTFQLNTAPILQFIIFQFISVPPNFVWQQYLEARFPGFAVEPAIVDPKKDDNIKGKGKEIVPQKKLNVWNTIMKLSLDQTVGMLLNTILFVAGMAILRGETDFAIIVDKIKDDSWPLMAAGYKLWPLVSLISFTLIPVQSRVVFGSLIGVGWGIFLSLFASH